jgi:hypothetical protein
MIQLPLSTLLDALVLAGHGFDTGRSTPLRESKGDDDGGGIGMGPILAVTVLALVTVALLISFSSSATKAKLRSLAPFALIAVVITVPLVLWAASSGGDDEKLIVERWINDAGKPELIVPLGEDDSRVPPTTEGQNAIRVQCRDRDGQVVLDARPRPRQLFNPERGYDYPHAHQPVSRQQFQRADRCLVHGTDVRLEAEVEGALAG